MKMFFSQKRETGSMPEEDLSPVALQDSIEKTRRALRSEERFSRNAETDG